MKFHAVWGQAFQPAIPNWPKGRLESLPHKPKFSPRVFFHVNSR